MNRELKRALYELQDMCSSLDDNNFSTVNPEKLKSECINFLTYLSSSDGTVSEYEADFIKIYFDFSLSTTHIRKYIEENFIYAPQFEKTVPELFQKLLERDNLYYEQNKTLPISYSEAYIKVFESLGKEFLSSDGEVTTNEINDFSIYLGMLNDYKNNNALFLNSNKAYATKSISHSDKDSFSKLEEQRNPKDDLNKLIEELNNLIGLLAVKKDVNSLIHLQEIKQLRSKRGLKEIPVSNHLVFYGNPGTGKTTVARLLARIYHAMGILSKGQFVEVDRSGLVAGYVGQTALKVQEIVEKSLGGVLFIDEAYALSYSESKDDYGQEAIDTLLKAMEDNRDDFIVIVAGYPDLMMQFVDSNPGLKSRFNKYIHFEDYNGAELTQIFKVMCKNAGYYATDEVINHVSTIFEFKSKNKGKNFANAREVRNFFEKAMVNQADRLYYVENPTDVELCTFEIEDVINII